MIDALKNMNLGVAVLILAGLFLINFLYMLWFKSHIQKYFVKTGSPELTLHHARIFNQYVYLLLIAVSSFSFTLIMGLQMSRFKDFSPFMHVLSLVFAFFLLGLLILCNQLIMHDTMKQIRGTTESRKEGSGKAVRGILLIFIPMILMFSVFIFLQSINLGSFFSNGFGGMLIPIAMIIIIQVVLPLFIGSSLKAKPMQDSELKQHLLQFVDQVGLRRVQLYTWPTKSSKTANAMVTGYGTKRIFISDYLMDHFSDEEIISILAHEIGHIKRFHLWIRLGLILLFIFLMYGLGSFFDWGDSHGYTMPIWLGILIFVGVMAGYLGVALRFFFRIQERQADAYVLILGIDYRIYAGALLKLAQLNHMMTKMNKLDEKFQTHPSIARRIYWVIEKANGDPNEIDLI